MWAEAWLSSESGQGSLTVQLRNFTLQPITMSYIMDLYIAQLRDGSVETLEKADFFNYPSLLGTGQQVSVRLRLPKTRPVREMTALVIRLEEGKRVLALNPPQAPAPAPDAPPSAPVVPALEPVPTMAMPPIAPPAPPVMIEPIAEPAPAPEPPASPAAVEPPPAPPMVVEPPPALPAAPAAEAPVIAEPPPAVPAEWVTLPSAEIPVVVEFAQEFGGSLTLHVSWDDGGPSARVYPEERKVFRVAPGPHTCTLRSEVQGLAPVTTAIPVVITQDPVRLIVRGSVTLDGPALQVEVWNNVTNDLLLERTVQPAP